MSKHVNSLRSIHYALGANLAIAIAKMVGWWFTSSGSLLAEALHSVADTGNQGLLLWGLRQAKAPASPKYPLGHGRAIYFWSFIVALMLFSMGGLLSIYEGVQKLEQHEGLSSPWVAIGILACAVLAESISLRAALVEINKVRGALSLWRWFRQARRSELIIVAAEDTAALVGLSFALVAVLATTITGNNAYDAAGSIAIGILLVTVAGIVGAQVKGLLIGQSAAPQVTEAIADLLKQRSEIRRVLSLITLQQGEQVMVAVKAQMRPVATPREMLDDINRCEVALKQAFPQIRWIFFEPDAC